MGRKNTEGLSFHCTHHWTKQLFQVLIKNERLNVRAVCNDRGKQTSLKRFVTCHFTNYRSITQNKFHVSRKSWMSFSNRLGILHQVLTANWTYLIER